MYSNLGGTASNIGSGVASGAAVGGGVGAVVGGIAGALKSIFGGGSSPPNTDSGIGGVPYSTYTYAQLLTEQARLQALGTSASKYDPQRLANVNARLAAMTATAPAATVQTAVAPTVAPTAVPTKPAGVVSTTAASLGIPSNLAMPLLLIGGGIFAISMLRKRR